MSLPIYLDHHATTPVDPRVLEAMLPFLGDDFGNPASRTHVYGWRAEAAVDQAREAVADAIGADPDEIIFTSGATESNNLALFGTARRALARGACHLVTVATEHASVLDPCQALERSGCRVTRLGVGASGLLSLNELSDAIGEDTALVSVMAANNETGVLQPWKAIGELCRERGVPFHCDAAQAVGKVPLSVSEENIDLLSVSAHKVYGPKGIGVLCVRKRRPRLRLEPMIYGGGHQGGLRSGTLPTQLVVGLGKALELAALVREEEAERLLGLRSRLLDELRRELPGVHVNGDLSERLPGNLHVSFEGVDADPLVADLYQVALSTGSACSSAEPGPSHVLQAMGLPEERVRGGLRFGLGRGTDAAQIESAAAAVVQAVSRQRAAGRAGTQAHAPLPPENA